MSNASTAASASVIHVIGHRNPDADAICSAIAYAALKEARGEKGYVAARCGNSNARIDTILGRFRQPLPVYLSDVWPRVRDLMDADVAAVPQNATCAEALELIEGNRSGLLPVVDPANRVVGTISLSHLGSLFIPKIAKPKLMRQVHGSLDDIARALKATVIHMVDGSRPEDFYVRVGTMDLRSFWKISEREGIPASQALMIVGDRRDIQLRAIELGLRGIIVTSGIPIDDEVVAQARARGVSVISSPYDSATTAWGVRTASNIERVVERSFGSVSRDARVSDIRRKMATLAAPALMVLDEDGALAGVLSKSDILKPILTRLVLVDHNELTQAVSGAEEVLITEIIDHHRLGPMSTPAPILFINDPVGSTCTIVADLFRSSGLTPSPEVAGIMMSGLITDTLHLNSPTTTRKDADILNWLAGVAGEKPGSLAEAIFASGSVILANTADAIVQADHKVYTEEGVRFAVAQVEELGFANFWSRAKDIAKALDELRTRERLSFAALLVTDINTQNSLLLFEGNPELKERITYSHVENEGVFDLPGIVSRKKQLIPYLTSLLREIRG
jgi:manganese-dependent inorganic pyrophosphatase